MLIATLPVVTVLAGFTGQPFMAVQSSTGATPATGCFAATVTIVGCYGNFDAIIVFGNGLDELHGADGNDTMQPFEGPDV